MSEGKARGRLHKPFLLYGLLMIVLALSALRRRKARSAPITKELA